MSKKLERYVIEPVADAAMRNVPDEELTHVITINHKGGLKIVGRVSHEIAQILLSQRPAFRSL